MTPAGFPHSDIHGSLPAFGFPWLFVDRYVLLRLPVPRHPPCALFSLTCPSTFLKVGVFQSRSNHFWVLLAVHTPCSSMCIPKFKDTFVRSTQTLFVLLHILLCFFIQFSRYSWRRAVRALPCTYRTPCPRTYSLPLFGRALCFLVPRVLPFRSVLCGVRIASSAAGGLKWTRTIDLTLIRRAL